MKKVLTVVGARPQFIKAAPISQAFAERDDMNELVVHTGQHFDADMSDVFFEELGMSKPAFNLGVHGGHHGEMTARMLTGIESIILEEKPDLLLVYGDTNSTLAGALAAAKLHVPVAHIEAGLRSFNRAMPEELNRILTDHVSTLLFCPTKLAIENLTREGISDGVLHVGDVMFDAALAMGRKARSNSTILDRLSVREGEFSLATLHRAENTDDPEKLNSALAFLKAEAQRHDVVLPLHPRTRAAVERFGLNLDGLKTVPPVGYLDMAMLLVSCVEVFTDSGGVQKEAYFHRKLCTTLRSETEWVETIDAGWNRLWNGPERKPLREIDEYGDGHAAIAIVNKLGEEDFG